MVVTKDAVNQALASCGRMASRRGGNGAQTGATGEGAVARRQTAAAGARRARATDRPGGSAFLRRAGVRRPDPGIGTPARHRAAAALPLFPQQTRADRTRLSRGLRRSVARGMVRRIGRPTPAAQGAADLLLP